MNTEKIAQSLFDKIRSKFNNVTLGDVNAKSTLDPEKAKFFNFKYMGSDQKVFGDVTASLIDDKSLKVYFSKGITEKLNDNEKREWFAFLKDLRGFAKQNLLTFDTRDISRPGLNIRDVKQISHADSAYDKTEVMNNNVLENKMFGTSKSSYQVLGPVRIIVRHEKPVNDEIRGGRSRHINALFIENSEGERFKMPFKKLIGARAMARHVSNGGNLHDELGQHICEAVNEMNALGMFVRNHRDKVFEDGETMAMIESAVERFVDLHQSLRQLSGRRGYQTYKESFTPEKTELFDEINVDQIRERFVKRLFDDRLTPALEYVYKAHQRKKLKEQNPLVTEFEQWANRIVEGTWSFPDTEEKIAQLNQLLSDELPAGPDGDNAVNALYDILGDDELFDAIYKVSETGGDDIDVRDIVVGYIEKNHPELMNKLSIPDELKKQPEGSETMEPNAQLPMDANAQAAPMPAQQPVPQPQQQMPAA